MLRPIVADLFRRQMKYVLKDVIVGQLNDGIEAILTRYSNDLHYLYLLTL